MYCCVAGLFYFFFNGNFYCITLDRIQKKGLHFHTFPWELKILFVTFPRIRNKGKHLTSGYTLCYPVRLSLLCSFMQEHDFKFYHIV